MPERKFTLFHFSLIPIAQTSIMMRTQDTREEWLRHALKIPFEFGHFAGMTLHWVPQGDADECIVGLIQRTRVHELHQSPDEGGGEITKEEWQGAYVVVDPTHHDEGQRVAVENDVVGKPSSLIKSLVKHINMLQEAPYQIEIEPLFDASRFWAFANRHDNVMKKIDFDFVVPNMWSTESDLDADLRDTGRTTGAERVRVGFRSEHGVSTDNQKVREGVDYAERGAGTLSARAMDGTPFRSTKQPLISKIPAVKAGADAMLKYFAGLKRTILSRGKNPTLDDLNRTDDGATDN
ncbi:hypothetical protein [Sphingopyxis sp. H115]|uniref:hypothetical protein n=1 Tax=Sphingopyxis sp. H115 TaxID=1759073 RepID=UPI000A4D54E6|nr:hypothetical protein [Sphingopyxis sp. H115]